MRYNSPTTQLALLSAIVMLTTVLRRLLSNYLLKEIPTDLNIAYDSYWPTSLTACLSGFISLFLVNLIGARAILFFYSATSVLFFSSIVSGYKTNSLTFYNAMVIIDAAGYDFGRVATLVLVLAYPSERWKARALAVFLFTEHLSMTLGDLLVLRGTGSDTTRFNVSIAALCMTSLSPFFALAIAPSHTIVRNNGVYLLARETTLSEELCGTVAIFKNKYMLLLLPYMFSYPFLFGSANVPFPTLLAIMLYDIGRIFVALMSFMLDVPWASRRKRGMVSLVMLVVCCAVSVGVTIAMRMKKTDKSEVDPSWPVKQINDFIFAQAVSNHGPLLYTSYFFAGIASSFVELYGFWIIGTLTNDIKASARFVGTYQSIMSIGGMVGYQMVAGIPHTYTTSNIPTFISTGLTGVSFVFMYFVVRRISESNDWTLGSISGNDEPQAVESTESITIVADVKYQHYE
ncbi:hypothetical protein IWW50_005323 [Coemansia erecta]|nr:hypothetical protein GGF43_004781 [Coemansia sp. RSA 2618]KAJ2819810.1 hypothetical protein IWW50_005323 [Coemansia erecta]